MSEWSLRKLTRAFLFLVGTLGTIFGIAGCFAPHRILQIILWSASGSVLALGFVMWRMWRADLKFIEESSKRVAERTNPADST